MNTKLYRLLEKLCEVEQEYAAISRYGTNTNLYITALFGFEYHDFELLRTNGYVTKVPCARSPYSETCWQPTDKLFNYFSVNA